jgi:penicillin-binding protein 1C
VTGRRSGALVAVVSLAFAGLAIAFTVSLWWAPWPVPEFALVRGDWQSSDAWLLDRQGEPLSRVRIDHQRRRGDWLDLDRVSPAMTAVVLRSEDKRFFEHRGVDWRALLAATRQTLAGERRGGSTLSMQLAASLHPQLATGGRRNAFDKWRQLRAALALERHWSKQQILEAWFNLTPFRGELEGLDAASRALLGKRASGLDRTESALLAGLVRSPNAPWKEVARRACSLLADDGEACAAARARVAHGLRASPLRTGIEGAAPHLARRLLARPGERVVSTLDAQLQREAGEILQRNLRELEHRQVEDGALIVIDNATGDVLAWVGSSGELSRAGDVDGVLAPRQAGSTLKPFLYALALERRLLTAASILDDSPVAVTTPAGLYVPQNYDRAFKGAVSLRVALGSSLNVPAVRTLALVGYEPFHQQLKALGFDTLDRDADHYGFALALGGADVTLAALANAYRTLANGGRAGRLRVTTATEPDDPERDPVAVVDARAAWIVGDILADEAARATTFGFASALATPYVASVKTGTSKDMRDNWAIGYTRRHTVGVWVGNFSGAPMHDVSGVAGAAPVWREVMDLLHARVEGNDLPRPPDLVRNDVIFAAGIEPARAEWFIAGTEMARMIPVVAAAARPRIVTPAAGAIYALDPDIPRDRQRVALTARGASPGARFLLDDGRRIRADGSFLWLPPPGRRQVALLDSAGREVDRVRFEVRALPRQ